jgi:putative tricarboxylic transport membrane protein
MRKPISLAIACALLGVLALAFAINSFYLGFWKDGVAGPGLLPLCAALPLLVLLVLMWRASPPGEDARGSFKAPLGAIVALGVYAIVAPILGFVASTILLLMVWARGLYRKSWVLALVLAVLSVAAAVIMFQLVLDVPIPTGPNWP